MDPCIPGIPEIPGNDIFSFPIPGNEKPLSGMNTLLQSNSNSTGSISTDGVQDRVWIESVKEELQLRGSHDDW